MKKLTTLLFSSLFAVSAIHATEANFTVDTNWVYDGDGSTLITKTNSSDYTAVGIFGDITGVDVSSLSAFQSGIASLTTGTLDPVPAIVPIPVVWQKALNSGSSGNPASLLIYDNTDIGNWGVVTSSTFSTPELGAPTVSFTSSPDKWDTAVVGTLTATSFTLVPEPSSAALLAGLLALGSVMLRRRAA